MIVVKFLLKLRIVQIKICISMATQRVAGVVLKRNGHSNCNFKYAFTSGSKLSNSVVVKWLPPSSTAVIVVGDNQSTQKRWSSSQVPSKGMLRSRYKMSNQKMSIFKLGFLLNGNQYVSSLFSLSI